ncbi:unnamed protein product [Prunus brigantina]
MEYWWIHFRIFIIVLIVILLIIALICAVCRGILLCPCRSSLTAERAFKSRSPPQTRWSTTLTQSNAAATFHLPPLNALFTPNSTTKHTP